MTTLVILSGAQRNEESPILDLTLQAIKNKIFFMEYYVYMMTNKNNRVLYIGVTNNLARRVYEHKAGLIDGFTKKYNVHKLVYAEKFENIEFAIKREKQLKGWIRTKKNELVELNNHDWNDLLPTDF